MKLFCKHHYEIIGDIANFNSDVPSFLKVLACMKCGKEKRIDSAGADILINKQTKMEEYKNGKIEDDYQNMINNMRVMPNGEKTYIESLLEDLKSEIKICDKNIESVEDPSWANGYAVVAHWRSRKELAKELHRQIENHYLKGDV